MNNVFRRLSIIALMYSSVACGVDSPIAEIKQTATETTDQNDNSNNNNNEENREDTMKKDTIKLYLSNGAVLNATLVDNSSTKAFMDVLKDRDITINMNDYGNMEKVGYLPFNLPENEENIITEPGDIILYSNNQFVIYYATNKWSLTRLGKINSTGVEDLKSILGNGNIKVTISIK